MEIPLAPDREACCAVERLHEPARPRGPAPAASLDDHDVRAADARRPLRARDRRGQVRRAGRRGRPGVLPRGTARFPHALDDLVAGPRSRPGQPGAARAVDRLLRDLTFNPDRHLEGELTPGHPAMGGGEAVRDRRPGRDPRRSAWLASPRSGGPTRPSSRSCASHANGSSPSGRGCSTACGATPWPAIANIPSCSIPRRRLRDAMAASGPRRRPIVTTGKKSPETSP